MYPIRQQLKWKLDAWYWKLPWQARGAMQDVRHWLWMKTLVPRLRAGELVGEYLYSLHKVGAWRRPYCSTGICGRTTVGYGGLDHNGYWRFPVLEREDEEARRDAEYEAKMRAAGARGVDDGP